MQNTKELTRGYWSGISLLHFPPPIKPSLVTWKPGLAFTSFVKCPVWYFPLHPVKASVFTLIKSLNCHSNSIKSYSCFHFIYEESEAQRGEVASSKSNSWYGSAGM